MQYQTGQNLAKSAHSRSGQYYFWGIDTCVLEWLPNGTYIARVLHTRSPPKMAPHTDVPASDKIPVSPISRLRLNCQSVLQAYIDILSHLLGSCSLHAILNRRWLNAALYRLRLKVSGPKRKSDYSTLYCPQYEDLYMGNTPIHHGMHRTDMFSLFAANYRCYGLILLSSNASAGWGFGSPGARAGAIWFAAY